MRNRWVLSLGPRDGIIRKHKGFSELSAIQDIEQRSISIAKWANLFMAVAGIAAALASNADALMLDGLFSGVNFVIAIIAARVALSVARPPDRARPFGYEIDEAVFVMFRALILIGILTVAFYNAVDKVVTYMRTGTAPELELGWVLAYAAFMVAICFALAILHHVNWRRGGKTSKILETERSAALIDGAMSGAAGIAFLGLNYLKGTQFALLVPVSDSIVIILLAAIMIPQPLKLFRGAMDQVLGSGVDDKTLEELRKAITGKIDQARFTLLDVGAARIGRSLFYLVYLKAENAVDSAEIDALRDHLRAEIEPLHRSQRMEIILSEQSPYAAAPGNSVA